MKKIFNLALMGCICGMIITGCGEGSDPDKKSIEPTETVEDTKETKEIIETPIEEAKKETDGENVRWPKSGLADLLPVPEGEIGNIIQNDSNGFSIEIDDISEDIYIDYVDECLEKGFNVNHTILDDIFNGENEQGYFLSIMYVDDKQMLISLNTPKEAEGSAEEPTERLTKAPAETEAATEPQPAASDEIRPEIKEAIDSYEAFFNEYCEFMKKYEESNGDLSLMTDYTSYIAQYAETMQKFQAMENEELNDAELAYYLEVSGRILAMTAEFM